MQNYVINKTGTRQNNGKIFFLNLGAQLLLKFSDSCLYPLRPTGILWDFNSTQLVIYIPRSHRKTGIRRNVKKN